MKEIYSVTLKITYNKVEESKKDKLVFDMRSQEFICTKIEIENAIEAEKQEIFKKFKLLHYEDSPSLIIHRAIEKFSRDSPTFARKQQELQNFCNLNLEIIFNDKMTSEKLDAAVRK